MSKKKFFSFLIFTLIFLSIFNYSDPYISSLFYPKKNLVQVNLYTKDIELKNSCFNFSLNDIKFVLQADSEHHLKSFTDVNFVDWGGNIRMHLDSGEEEIIKYLSSKAFNVKEAIISGTNSNLKIIYENSTIGLDIENPNSIKMVVYYNTSSYTFPLFIDGDASIYTQLLGRIWYGFVIPSLTIYKNYYGKLILIYDIKQLNNILINTKYLSGYFSSDNIIFYQAKGNILILENHTLLGHDKIRIISKDDKMHNKINFTKQKYFKVKSNNFIGNTWINDKPIPKNQYHLILSSGYYSIPSIIIGIVSNLISEFLIRIYQNRVRARATKV